MTARMTRVPLDDVAEQFGASLAGVRRILGSRRMRLTPSVLAVLAVLEAASIEESPSCPSHLEAHDLWGRAQRLGVRLDETTVYRAIGKLESVGLVDHVAVYDRATRYGLTTPAHNHAVCEGCGTVQPIAEHRLRRLAGEAAKSAEFVALSSGAITVYGRCQRCSAVASRGMA